MALSVVDLYSKILPKTNCKDCKFPTCIAFAGMVVSEKLPLGNCPHIAPDVLEKAQAELNEQYAQGKWLKKDMAAEALSMAKGKAASMDLKTIAAAVDGIYQEGKSTGPLNGAPHILLPYFNSRLLVSLDRVADEKGNDLTRNEQTFVYIHLAAGASATPTGNLKSLKEFPNTVSKIASMRDHVEAPLKKTFAGQLHALEKACIDLGGTNVSERYDSADLAFQFRVFPKVYTTLLFWDQEDGFEPDAKLMFDETIIQHMDIEAIMFLSEHLAKQLMAHGQ